MTDEKKEPQVGFLDDGRPIYTLALDEATSTYTLCGPWCIIGGFPSSESAHGWLLQFFDNNARRAHDLAAEAAMDEKRLGIEREEMLARLLEPKLKQ